MANYESITLKGEISVGRSFCVSVVEGMIREIKSLEKHFFEHKQRKPLALSLCGLTARIFLNQLSPDRVAL